MSSNAVVNSLFRMSCEVGVLFLTSASVAFVLTKPIGFRTISCWDDMCIHLTCESA